MFDRDGWWQGLRGQRRHESGFRLNWLDICLLGLASIAAIMIWLAIGATGWLFTLPLLPALHFFCFCNILRIRRTYELIWISVVLASFVWMVTARISMEEMMPILWSISTSTFLLLSIAAYSRSHTRGIFVRAST